MGVRWTPEADEMLMKLLREGRTGAQAAPLLSNLLGVEVSRCAVIGRADRLEILAGRKVRKPRERLNPETRAALRKAACTRGHPLSGDNLYIKPSGVRACRLCKKLTMRKIRKARGTETPQTPVGFSITKQIDYDAVYSRAVSREDAPAPVRDASGNPVTLKTLGHNQCRFAIGGRGVQTEFCANDIRWDGKTWCEYHQRVVYLTGSALKARRGQHRRVTGPIMAEMITR